MNSRNRARSRGDATFRWLVELARPLVLLGLTAGILGLVALLMSPASPVAAINAVSGGAGILDEKPWATEAHVNDLLMAYGTEGRRLYLSTVLVIDTVTPVVINFFTMVALAGLLCRQGWYRGPLRWIALVPILGWSLDMAENAIIAGLMIAEAPSGWPLGVVGYLTGCKFVVNGTTALAALVLLVINVRGKRGTARPVRSTTPLKAKP